MLIYSRSRLLGTLLDQNEMCQLTDCSIQSIGFIYYEKNV